jgi:hypothetical protein
MQKKDKRRKSEAAWAVVFLIYVTSAIWFYYTNQPFAAVIYIFTSFLVLRRVFHF